VSDHEQLTCAELNRLVAPGAVGAKRRRCLLDGQGVVRRPGREACVSPPGELINARRPCPHTGAPVFGALSLGEEPWAVAVLAGLGCRTPVDLDLQASTVGSGPRTDAERHTCRSQGEHLLPGCERVPGLREASIG